MTKIEILVIGLIVGVLGTMAVVAVTSARSSMRDAVRIANVREVQTALEFYFNNVNSYPETSAFTALGQSHTQCFGDYGFASNCSSHATVYLDVVSSTIENGLNELSSCETSDNAYCFMGADQSYRIQFELEHDNPLLELQKGLNCATENGIVIGECTNIASTGTTQEEENTDNEFGEETAE